MSEWWTYGLSDFLMFSPRTWHRLLELHNAAWLPLHAVTWLAAGWLLWALRSRPARGPRFAFIGAALAWLFVAGAFHWMRYAPINWAASYFAIAFGLQGLLLLLHGAVAREVQAAPAPSRHVGHAMVLAALLYPLIAVASNRPLAQAEWVGLMPDPTVLATLGMLLCIHRGAAKETLWRRRVWLLPIPLLWCAVTGATLWTLKSPEWLLMPSAGLLALAMELRPGLSARHRTS